MRTILYLKAEGKLVEKHGTICSLSEAGVLLENSSEISFVSSDALENFMVIQKDQIAPSPSFQKDDGGSEQDGKKSEATPGPAKQDNYPPAPDPGNNDARISDGILDDAQFMTFFSPPRLETPRPDFAVTGLSRDDSAELVRWKNRYEYALKIDEIQRVTEDIRPIARLAERLRNQDLHLLAGSVAVAVNINDLAEQQFTNALALGSARAGAGLTWLYYQAGNFSKAVEVACRAVAIDPGAFGGPDSATLLLGRLLAKLPNRDVQGLSDAIVLLIGLPSETPARNLLAFALRETYPAAARAALTGDIDDAKRAATEAQVFSSLSQLGYSRSEGGQQVNGKKSLREIDEFGRVTASYPEKAFGFLTNEVTGETLFFAFGHVTDPELLVDVEAGLVGEKVYFVVQPVVKTSRNRYDQARSIRLRPNQDAELKRIRSEAKSAGPEELASKVRGREQSPDRRVLLLPKAAGPYTEAKRAEQLGDLESAEDLLRRVIKEGGGPYRQSAIKDLAMVLGRKNQADEAIQLLDDHRNELASKRSVDNLKATLLVKANRYNEAAHLYVSLYNSASPGTRERTAPAKQAGVCFLLLSDFTNAIKYLEIARRLLPGDATILPLVEKARKARESGRLSADDTKQLQELAGLAVVSGLSSFATFFMQTSDYKGADERSITRGFFDASDFQKIDRQLRAVRGRQPRMKGQLYQTLAAMTVKAPLEAGDISVQDSLRSCFFFMGEAAINDKLAPDSVRCFMAEAAHLAMRADQVNDIARYLLNTYLSEPLSTEELSTENLSGKGRVHLRLQDVLTLFEKDQDGWRTLTQDFPYYAAVAEYAATTIESEARRNRILGRLFPSSGKIEELRTKEIGRLQSEMTILRPLLTHSITADGLRHISETLHRTAAATRFKLDQERLSELGRLTNDASAYWAEQDYIEREAIYGRITGGLKALSDAIKKEPTRLTIETSLPLADRLLGEIIDDFDKFRSDASASLDLNNLLKDDYYIPDADDVITLALEMTSERGSTPIEGIMLTATSDDRKLHQVEACHSPELLRSGNRREIQLRIKPLACTRFG
jgi:tetratricopeptide (TPR) repeat protein